MGMMMHMSVMMTITTSPATASLSRRKRCHTSCQ